MSYHQSKRKITWVMQLIEEIERVPEQYFKKLVNTDGIWEIRAQIGSNSINFIATNGFQKKSQKTPAKEILLAEKRKIEHISRKRGK